MDFRELKVRGAYEITAKPFKDARGYFVMTYEEKAFAEHGLATHWVQENQSRSVKNVVRGLHFQHPPATETKLVRVVHGTIWDVFVDVRKSSPTFGQWDAIELSEDKQNMAYIPKGYAHGFAVLSDIAVVCYKVDHLYAPAAQGGLKWDDPQIAIPWPVSATDAIVSEKDQAAIGMADFNSPF